MGLSTNLPIVLESVDISGYSGYGPGAIAIEGENWESYLDTKDN